MTIMGHMDLADLMLPMLGLKYIFLKARQDYNICTYINEKITVKLEHLIESLIDDTIFYTNGTES